MTVSIVACACGVVIGIVGFAFALGLGNRRPELNDTEATIEVSATNGRRTIEGQRHKVAPISAAGFRALSPKVGLSLVGALVVGAVTRWPVAGMVAAVAPFALPAILRSTSSRNTTRRTEAVAVWTELLRDTLTASAGLAQAIVATAGVAPDEIREPVAHLADRIMSGASLDDALRVFGLEVNEPSAEQVVSALRLAVSSRAQRLVDLLSALADSTREEVAMRLRVEASRASARSGVRTVIWFSSGFVLLLMIVAHSYLAPFGSATGQLVLAFVGASYGTGLALMVRFVQPTSSARLSRSANNR
jgi:Flp pilus assembly protein TadB